MAENRFQPQEKGGIIPQSVQMFLDGSAKVFHGWESLTIEKNLDALAQSFSFNIPQKFQQTESEFALKPGTTVAVFVNQERVITGRVEQVSIALSANVKTVNVSGRTLNADLVDCSATGVSEYKNINILALARELVAPYGLKVFNSLEGADTEMISKIAVKKGDTVFEILDKAARLLGGFWISTREGNIRLTRAGRGRAISKIFEDVNMESGTVTIDDTQRFSEYTVLGSQPATDNYPGVNASSAEGKATDSGVFRFRPLVLTAEGNADSALAKKRAQWEATTRLGKAIRIDVNVQGWLQQEGTIWGLNQLINLRSETLGLDGDFLSTSIKHVRNDSDGTMTMISLTRQDAYTPEPDIPAAKKGGKSLEAIVALSQQA